MTYLEEPFTDPKRSQFKPFVGKQRILVRAPPSNPQYGINLEASKKIKTFFFIKQGESKASVVVNKNVFVDNETA